MDKIGLALMAKIDKIKKDLLKDGTKYLAFMQTSPIYTQHSFKFHPDQNAGIDHRDAMLAQADFSTMTNLVPKVGRFWNPQANHIWQVYKEALDQAEPARSSLSQAEEARLKEARDFVDDTVNRDTYYEYRTRHEVIVEEYIDAQMSNYDGNQVEFDLEERIKELEQKKEDSLTEWIIQGKKEIYEGHVETIRTLEGRRPGKFLSGYRSDIDTAERHAVFRESSFYPTSYLPNNFFEDNGSNWAPITMHKSEIESLFQYAKTELFKDHPEYFSNVYDTLDIKRLRAEIGTITIDRGWMHSAFLEGRYWKLPPHINALSDGDTSAPKGSLTAYPVEMIFIKKLDIELEENSDKNDKVLEDSKKDQTPIFVGPVPLKVPYTKSVKSISNLSTPVKVSPEFLKFYNQKYYKHVGGLNYTHPVKTKTDGITYNIGQKPALTEVKIGNNLKANVNLQFFGQQKALQSALSLRNTNPGTFIKTRQLNVHPNKAGLATQVVLDHVFINENIRLNNTNAVLTGTTLQNKPFIAGGNTVKPEFVDIARKDYLEILHGAHQFKTTKPVFGFVGLLKAETGEVLKNVPIKFKALKSGRIHTVTSKNNGTFTITLPHEVYEVEIELEGFNRFIKSYAKFKQQSPKLHKIEIELTEDHDYEFEIENQYDGYWLAGFICHKLPKSPNPDPNLQW